MCGAKQLRVLPSGVWLVISGLGSDCPSGWGRAVTRLKLGLHLLYPQWRGGGCSVDRKRAVSHPGQGVDGVSLGLWGFPPGQGGRRWGELCLTYPQCLGWVTWLMCSQEQPTRAEVLAWLFMLMLSQREVDIYLHEDPEGQGWEPQIPRPFLGPLFLLEPRAAQRAEFAKHLQAGLFAGWWQDIFNWFRKHRCKYMLGIYICLFCGFFFFFTFFLNNWKCGWFTVFSCPAKWFGYIHMLLFQILLHDRLLHDIEGSPLFCRVGPCCLFILCIVVCIC